MKNPPASRSSSKSHPAAEAKHRSAQKKPTQRETARAESSSAQKGTTVLAKGARRITPSAKKEREAPPQRDLGHSSKTAQQESAEARTQKAHGFQLVTPGVVPSLGVPALPTVSAPATLPFDGGRFLQQAQEGLNGLGQSVERLFPWGHPPTGDAKPSEVHDAWKSKILSSAVERQESVVPAQQDTRNEQLAPSTIEPEYDYLQHMKLESEQRWKVVKVQKKAFDAGSIALLGMTEPHDAPGHYLEPGSHESLEGARKFLGLSSSRDGLLERISKFERIGLVNSKNNRLYMGVREFLTYAKEEEKAEELFSSFDTDQRKGTLALFNGSIAAPTHDTEEAAELDWAHPELAFNLADLPPSAPRTPNYKPMALEDNVRKVLDSVLRSKAKYGRFVTGSNLQALTGTAYSHSSDTFDEDKMHRIMERLLYREPGRGRSGMLPYQFEILLSLGLSKLEIGKLYEMGPEEIKAQRSVLKAHWFDLFRDPALRTNRGAGALQPPLTLGQKQLNHLPGTYLQPDSVESQVGLSSFWPEQFSNSQSENWSHFLRRLGLYSRGRVGLINANGNRFYASTRAIITWLESAGAGGVRGRMVRLAQLGDTLLIFDGPMAQLPGESKAAYAARLGLNVDQVSSGVDFIIKRPPAFSFSLKDLFKRIGERRQYSVSAEKPSILDNENTVRSIVREVLRRLPRRSKSIPPNFNQLAMTIRDDSGALDENRLDRFLDKLFEHPRGAGESQLRRQQLMLGAMLGLLNDELSSIHDFAIDRVGRSWSEGRRSIEDKLRHPDNRGGWNGSILTMSEEQVASLVEGIEQGVAARPEDVKRRFSKLWKDVSVRREMLVHGRDYLVMNGSEYILVSGETLADPKARSMAFGKLQLGDRQPDLLFLYKDGTLETGTSKLQVLNFADWKKLVRMRDPSVPLKVSSGPHVPEIQKYLKYHDIDKFNDEEIKEALGWFYTLVTPVEARSMVMGDIYRMSLRAMRPFLGGFSRSNLLLHGMNKIQQRIQWHEMLEAKYQLSKKYGPRIYYIDKKLLNGIVRHEEQGLALPRWLRTSLQERLARYSDLQDPNLPLPPPYPNWPVAMRPPLQDLMPDDEAVKSIFGAYASKLSNLERKLLYADLVLRASFDEMAAFFGGNKEMLGKRLNNARRAMGWHYRGAWHRQ